MFETAIESLARSGRLVRLRELGLGYMPPGRTAVSGAITALLLTYGKYYWYAINVLFNMGLRWIGNRTLDIGPPPPFVLFVYDMGPTLAFLTIGALLALVRRWSVRQGRFLVIQIGPIAQIRAGWHVPLGILSAGLLIFGFLHALPLGLTSIATALISILAVIAWEMTHDLLFALFLSPSERARAIIEFDLKEALAQDETAIHWRVDRIGFDVSSGSAVLTGEFPTVEAVKRVEQVAKRVKGVRNVTLITQ